MSKLGSKADINDVYRERNEVVAVLASVCGKLDEWYACVFEPESDWPVVFIQIPVVGQVSWHVSQTEYRQFFPNLPVITRSPWDGHTDEVKSRRMRSAALMVSE